MVAARCVAGSTGAGSSSSAAKRARSPAVEVAPQAGEPSSVGGRHAERLEHGLGEVGGERRCRSPASTVAAGRLDPGVAVDAPARPGGESTPPSRPRPDAWASRWRSVEPVGPAGWSRSTLPSSTATSTATRGEQLGDRREREARGPGRRASARRSRRRRRRRAAACRTGQSVDAGEDVRAQEPSQTMPAGPVAPRRRAEHDVGRVALVDVADQAHVDAVAAQLPQPGLEGRGPDRRGCRAAGSPAGGCSRRSSSWRCPCAGPSERLAPPPCHRLPCHTSTLPAGISAGIESSSAPYVGGVVGAGGEPGMIRVAPFSSVKSVSAHIVLQTVGGCGFGIGMSWSSAWIGCAVSPGSMAIDDSDEMRQPRSSTPSTTGSTRGVHRAPARTPGRGPAGCRCGPCGGPRSRCRRARAPRSRSSRSRVVAQLVEEGGLDGVRDDRVALLGDLLDVPHVADGTGRRDPSGAHLERRVRGAPVARGAALAAAQRRGRHLRARWRSRPGYSPRASRAGRAGSCRRRAATTYPWWRVVTVDGRLVPGHEVEHARRLRTEGVDTDRARADEFGVPC